MNNSNQDYPPEQKAPSNPAERLNEGFFTQVSNKLANDVRDGILKPIDLLVYIVFLNHQRGKDHSWPSNATVARLTNQCDRNAGRCIKRLCKAGHLLRKGKTECQTRRTYALTLAKGANVVKTPVGDDSKNSNLFALFERQFKEMDGQSEPVPENTRRVPDGSSLFPSANLADSEHNPHNRIPSQSQDETDTEEEIPF
jgi:hypothetical protein